jgi:hypothetical protein
MTAHNATANTGNTSEASLRAFSATKQEIPWRRGVIALSLPR